MPLKENDPAKEHRPIDISDHVTREVDPKYRVLGFMIDPVKAWKTIAGFFRKRKDKE